KGDLIVGLDIGTTKICAIVGEVTDEGIDIIGIGTHPSRGLRKGVVVNIETSVQSNRRAIEEAELMAGCEVNTVFTGIAGGHIKGINSQGIVAVKNKEVREADIQRVIDAAKAVAIPLDREVIHVLPQEFVIDDQGGIKEPLGMSGVRLEAKVHIVTAAVSSAQNIIKCANRTGLNVADIVLQPLASAKAVLTEEERELGVCLVDIGGGTTDLAIIYGGSIVHNGVTALGCNNLTSDIAIGLRTPAHEAEKIKQRWGTCLPNRVGAEETIEVPSVGGREPRTIARQVLVDILEPRVEEIFQLVHREIQRSGYADLIPAGVVITGGSTLLDGMTELAEEVLGVPVRQGYPQGVGGLVDVVKSPMYATGVGLVLYGCDDMDSRYFPIRQSEGTYKRLTERMRDWLREIF